MYGPQFRRIGWCAGHSLCGEIPTIYIYDPYEWDGMTHEQNPRYMCESCADKFFVSKRLPTIKQMEKNCEGE